MRLYTFLFICGSTLLIACSSTRSGIDVTNATSSKQLLVQNEDLLSISTPDEVAQKINYPIELSDSGIKGELLATLWVGEQGNVDRIDIEKGLHPELDKNVKEVLSKERYSPPTEVHKGTLMVPVIHAKVIFDGNADKKVAVEFSTLSFDAKQNISHQSPMEVMTNAGSLPTPPILKGGLQSISKNLRYPQKARQFGIQGTVVVQFTVTTKGRVKDPVVTQGIGYGCDKEAIRVVKRLRFVPGTVNGEPVEIPFMMPISFRL